jgi:hemerythrin-like domain-containing protein
MSTDAIVLLKEEHTEIRRAFRSFMKARDTETAQQEEAAHEIFELLARHTYVENEVMYPRVRELVPNLERDVLESYEEHHVADLLLAELVDMEPYEERFSAKMTVLIQGVESHMDEEEDDLFPRIRDALGRKQLQEIGSELLRARESAPRQPERKSSIARALKAVLE